MTQAHTAIETISGRGIIAQTFNGFSQKMDFTIPKQHAGRALTVMNNFHSLVSAGASAGDAQDGLRSDLAAEHAHHAGNPRIKADIALAGVLVDHLPVFLDTKASATKVAQANTEIQAASNKLVLELS